MGKHSHDQPPVSSASGPELTEVPISYDIYDSVRKAVELEDAVTPDSYQQLIETHGIRHADGSALTQAESDAIFTDLQSDERGGIIARQGMDEEENRDVFKVTPRERKQPNPREPRGFGYGLDGYSSRLQRGRAIKRDERAANVAHYRGLAKTAGKAALGFSGMLKASLGAGGSQPESDSAEPSQADKDWAAARLTRLVFRDEPLAIERAQRDQTVFSMSRPIVYPGSNPGGQNGGSRQGRRNPLEVIAAELTGITQRLDDIEHGGRPDGYLPRRSSGDGVSRNRPEQRIRNAEQPPKNDWDDVLAYVSGAYRKGPRVAFTRMSTGSITNFIRGRYVKANGIRPEDIPTDKDEVIKEMAALYHHKLQEEGVVSTVHTGGEGYKVIKTTEEIAEIRRNIPDPDPNRS